MRTKQQSILFGRGTGAVFEKINNQKNPEEYVLIDMNTGREKSQPVNKKLAKLYQKRYKEDGFVDVKIVNINTKKILK